MMRFIAPLIKAVSSVYHRTHWFTDKEAWMLFRIFAFAEVVGWTLLISAIIYRKFDLPLDDIFVSIAGTIHGLFFGLYFIFVIITARSMLWGPFRTSTALLAGMPPYTSFVFERAMSYYRKKHPVFVEPPKGYDD